MADGEQYFNPPPGWPPAPAGWSPPLGWVPPADWPPVPPGWQLWLPMSSAVAPTPPPTRPGATPWYQRTWGTLLLLVMFFPVGLFLMWRRQAWGRGVKWGLTGATAVFVVIAMASGGSSPSANSADHPAAPSTPVSTAPPPTSSSAGPSDTSPVASVAPVTVRPTATRPPAANAPVVAPVTSTPRTSRPAPVLPPTTAAPPVQRTSAPVSSCYPLTNGGNCYEPGEFCRKSDHGATGIAGNGERIVCRDNNGWRWEPL